MSNLSSIALYSALAIAIFILGLLFGFLIDKGRLHTIRVRQNRGESAVRKLVVTYFRSPNFHLLNNITLPFRDGTTQIDHILISTKGIFVIETKEYSGWIFADENSKQWMQIIYKTKHQFQNPIRQNYKHIKAVQQLLDFVSQENIHSVVVFTGSAQFKSTIPKGVFYLKGLTKYLESFESDVISKEQVELCVGRLECKRYEVTKRTDVEHRAYLAQKFGDSK